MIGTLDFLAVLRIEVSPIKIFDQFLTGGLIQVPEFVKLLHKGFDVFDRFIKLRAGHFFPGMTFLDIRIRHRLTRRPRSTEKTEKASRQRTTEKSSTRESFKRRSPVDLERATSRLDNRL